MFQAFDRFSARRDLKGTDVSFEIPTELEGLEMRPDLQEWLGKLSSNHQLIQKKLENAINGITEECVSVFDDYIDNLLRGLTGDDLAMLVYLVSLSVDLWGIIFVVVFGRKSDGTIFSNDFYPDKQQGTEFAKRFRDLQRFWDTYPNNIALFPYTMNFLKDDSLALPLLHSIYGMDTATAAIYVNFVRDLFQALPTVGYSFPLWTLNAFAFRFDDKLTPSGPGIAIGDGYLQYLEFAGMGDAGPDMVLFHEFGHQVQFGNNVKILDTAKNTRYRELMADALAAYYGHHPRGASFQTKRITEITESTFAVGDCDINAVGHHGTPSQRARAVKFATTLIDQSKKKGHILPSLDFIALFDAAYNAILNGP